MTKAFSLAINITTAELEEYHRCKNVDPATLLPENYHEYLDVFSNQAVHYPYNYTIKIKEGYQPLSAIIYEMSRDKIHELHWYLAETLTKRFI